MRNRNAPSNPTVTMEYSGDGVYQSATAHHGTTKLEDLAMRIYVAGISMGGSSTREIASGAIERANIFFDELEKTNEDE